jgi:hypothetical protein
MIGSRCRRSEISKSYFINRDVEIFFARERSHDDAPTARSMSARGNAPRTCPSTCPALQGRTNRVCMKESNLCGTRLQPRRKWSGFTTALQVAEKVLSFVGRAFRHDIKSAFSSGVLTPEGPDTHISATSQAVLAPALVAIL